MTVILDDLAHFVQHWDLTLPIIRVLLRIAFMRMLAMLVVPGTRGGNGDGQEETHDAAADRKCSHHS